MSLPRFSIRRPVTTVMIYIGVLLLGCIAWTRLPQELYPPIAYPQLTIVTHYKDAAPVEIEILITKPIEEVDHRLAVRAHEHESEGGSGDGGQAVGDGHHLHGLVG